MQKIVYCGTIHGKPYSGALSKIWFMVVHPQKYRRYIKRTKQIEAMILYSRIYYKHCVEFISDDIF